MGQRFDDGLAKHFKIGDVMKVVISGVDSD
jgi:hypothetical protein